MDEHSDEVTFFSEQVEQGIFEVVESTIKDKMYNESMVQTWVDEICCRVMKDLVDSSKPFKYVVSCVIMQKNGAGLHCSHSCFWDAVGDNVVVARWPNERRKDPNARMVCIVTVYGVAY